MICLVIRHPSRFLFHWPSPAPAVIHPPGKMGSYSENPLPLMLHRYVGFIYLSLSLFGCTTAPSHGPDSRQAACLQLYRKLDRSIHDHDVEDTGEKRIDGFPHLRSNRFLAASAKDSLTAAEYAQWLELQRRLDERARLLEFANLPSAARSRIGSELPTAGPLSEQLRDCGRLLNEKTARAGPTLRTKLAQAAAVPDDYQTWQRVVGLYPVARWFAANSIADLHRELNHPFQQANGRIPVAGRLIRYRPRVANMPTRRQVGAMLEKSYQNPLRIPLLSSAQLERLFARFAPVWEVDTHNENDAIGAVILTEDARPSIDRNRPAVYVQSAHTRYRGENLLQLVYQIWFPAREKTGLFDIYGGDLDSVIWRVTLSRQGRPIAYDSIHACGCYYLLFPGKGYRAAATTGDSEPVLAPRQISIDPYRQRLTIRVAARTHYLQRISGQLSVDDGKAYRLLPYDSLRSLPDSSGKRRNLFGPDGIIEDSARGERFLLWPFGVASPGAMRQWGSHAIAFIGRRHFDDADLLEPLLVPHRKQ